MPQHVKGAKPSLGVQHEPLDREVEAWFEGDVHQSSQKAGLANGMPLQPLGLLYVLLQWDILYYNTT